MYQIKAILLVVISLMLVVGYWLTNNDYFKEELSISIAVSRTPLSAPIYIADSLGFFSEAGLKVELIEKNGGNLTFTLMMDGAADFATSSDSVMMLNSFKSDDFENLATFVQSNHDIKVLTKSATGIHDIKGLRGKRIAIIQGSASEYFLDMMLAIAGVERSSVELINLPVSEMTLALENRHVDAIVVWEPFAFKAMKQLDDEAVLLSESNLYELTFNLLTKKSTTVNSGEKAEKLLAALKKAVEYIHQHESEAQLILKERLHLDQEFIAWIWGEYLYDLTLRQSLLLSLENEARWAISRGLTDKHDVPDFRNFMNPKPLKAVSQYSVSL